MKSEEFESDDLELDELEQESEKDLTSAEQRRRITELDVNGTRLGGTCRQALIPVSQ